jgi:hypothetical protein
VKKRLAIISQLSRKDGHFFFLFFWNPTNILDSRAVPILESSFLDCGVNRMSCTLAR